MSLDLFATSPKAGRMLPPCPVCGATYTVDDQGRHHAEHDLARHQTYRESAPPPEKPAARPKGLEGPDETIQRGPDGQIYLMRGRKALAGPFPNRWVAAAWQLDAQMSRLGPGKLDLFYEAQRLAGGGQADIYHLLGLLMLIERGAPRRLVLLAAQRPPVPWR